VTPRALVLALFVRSLYPLLLAASVWVLLRGHNEPGGGFIGGMLAVVATAVLAAAEGSAKALSRIPLGPLRLSAAGVGLSALSGAPALLLGRPYLEHLWTELPLGLAALPLSTVQLFDLGVYCAVWGALGGVAAAAIGIDEERP